MALSRVIALLMVSAAGAAQAQQAPSPAATQPASPTVSKADNSDKVTCRIHMEGNLPRRVCMTNAQWKKIDSQNGDASGQNYNNNYRCTMGPEGAC
ncbi:MAG: hypothetical protein ACTHJK_08765 [Sphingomicrobium sp.]